MWELDRKNRLSTKELILSNCDGGEDSWDCKDIKDWYTLDCKDIKAVNPKGNQPIFTVQLSHLYMTIFTL